MKIINISDVHDDKWRWIEPKLLQFKMQWRFINSKPRSWMERVIRKPDLARIRTALVVLKEKKDADLVVIHGPYIAFYFGLFSRLFNVAVPNIVYSFNFTSLPHGFARSRMTYAFKAINKFVVYSTMEKKLYSSWFNIPEEKIDICLWGVEKPRISDKAIINYPYITAIGGNSRDYSTLMEAMKLVPEIKLVAVMRPHNLADLDVPDNVDIRTNIPREQANNILGYARMMVLPLVGEEIPCGHVTLVAAMYLETPCVVTGSIGIDDYVTHDDTAIIVEVGNSESLANAIRALWYDDEMRNKLAEHGKYFVKECCTERSIVEHFLKFVGEQVLD